MKDTIELDFNLATDIHANIYALKLCYEKELEEFEEFWKDKANTPLVNNQRERYKAYIKGCEDQLAILAKKIIGE